MADELQRMLALADSGKLKSFPAYQNTPAELLQLRHVALSGDGEPTLCPNFAEAVQVVVHVRARNPRAFFKLALMTNGTGLDLRPVQESLQYFTHDDEIWIKLDAGGQESMDRINRSQVPLEKVISNILLVARHR